MGTEVAWRYADEFNLPRFVVINKLDRENANFAKALSTVESFSSTRLVKLQIPIGEKHDFKGVVDLISMKAFMGDGKTVADIPADLKSAADEARKQLIEAAAEGEDTLLEKYLESGELTQDELVRGLKSIVRNGTYFPVFCAAGGHEIGIAPLLNAIIDLMPSPADRPVVPVQGKSGEENLPVSDTGPVALYVWKTTADPFVGKMTYFRVRSGTISSDVHLMNIGKNADERLTGLHIQRGKESNPVKVAHAGDLAVVAKLSVTATGDTLCEKNHPLTIPVPKYPSRTVPGGHSPEDSGRCGQDFSHTYPSMRRRYDALLAQRTLHRADHPCRAWVTSISTWSSIARRPSSRWVWSRMNRRSPIVKASPEKLPPCTGIRNKQAVLVNLAKSTCASNLIHDGDFEFTDELVGMNLSKSYLAPIEKGIRSTMEKGVFAGYPLSNVKVIVFDGKEHPVDSKACRFRNCRT